MEFDPGHARPGEISDADAGRILEMLAFIGQSLGAMRESMAAIRAGMFGSDADSGLGATTSGATVSGP